MLDAAIKRAIANADRVTDEPARADMDAIRTVALTISAVERSEVLGAALASAQSHALDTQDLEALRAAIRLADVICPRREKATTPNRPAVSTNEAVRTEYFVLGRGGTVTAFHLERVFPSGVRTWDEAEDLGLFLMRLLGFPDAKRTKGGADGGLDVVAQRGCCQVKHWDGKVGRGDLQRLRGAALGKVPIFLAQAYTAQATGWADEAGVAVFAYDVSARARPLNAQARVLTNAAPRVDPFRGSAKSTVDLRHIRAVQWYTIVKMHAYGQVHNARDARRVSRGMKKIDRSVQRLLQGPHSESSFVRRVGDFESAVLGLAKTFKLDLPD
ncbi:MAG: restriction endonuclease [Actinomycetota bacterium]|nr:restriction endonuclease [Actinomycetota bacterium]